MKVICVDDEKLLLEEVVKLCETLPEIHDVKGFRGAKGVLAWLSENEADLAILDVDMPGMNGIALALKIKEIHPDIAIIFLTGYTQYAVDVIANRIQATGYLLKPVNRDRLVSEIAYAIDRSTKEEQYTGSVEVRTFGGFDLIVNGELVTFQRSKAKELLAYLVDRRGTSVTRRTLFAVLWEDDGDYTRQNQKILDVYIRSLRETLDSHGVGDIIEMKSGSLRVFPEKFTCDAYRFFDGDPEAINAYRGEYMSDYSWADMSEAYMDRMKS